MSVARLESQMGKTEEALKAGKDLIASAPGNTDNYEFYAQLCERYGGGGHPVVGAVSMPTAELPRARQAASEIAETLRQAAPKER